MLCWHWEREGKEILFIIIEMDSNRVILRQEYPPPGENSKQIVQPIWLSYSPATTAAREPGSAARVCPAVVRSRFSTRRDSILSAAPAVD
jgi:hypothetical protein